MNPSQDHRYVVVAILAMLVLPAVFLFGLMLGAGVKHSDFADSSNIALWVSAGSTLAIAILTIVLAKETWQLRLFQLGQLAAIRKAAIRPQIDVYMSRSKTSFNVMNVVVENVGSGIARNIRFRFKGSSTNGELTEPEQAVADRLNKMAMFNSGIQALSPQRNKRSFLFIVQEIFGAHKDDFYKICLTIEMSYEDAEGETHTSVAIWDFSELEGTSEMGYGDPTDKAAGHLEKISSTLQKLGRDTSSERFAVNIYTELDREKEREYWEEQREIWKANYQNGDS